METSSMNTEQSQVSSSSWLNFCYSLLGSGCTDLVMSQEYHSLPGEGIESDVGSYFLRNTKRI